MVSLDLDKPDLIIAYCKKCDNFAIEQPQGIVLDDTVLETSRRTEDGHEGKIIKLFLRRRL